MSKSPAKPWSKQKCENRFVTGDRITLSQLATLSGQPLGTLKRWSIKGSWVSKRDLRETEMRLETQEKIIQKTSEKLSDELCDIAIANCDIHCLFRDYIAEIAKIKKEHLRILLTPPFEGQQELLKKLETQLDLIKMYHSSYEINQLSVSLSRATQGVADATGLNHYLSGNASAKRIEDMGGTIVFAEEDRNSAA